MKTTPFFLVLLLMGFLFGHLNVQGQKAEDTKSPCIATIAFEQIDHLIYLPVIVNGVRLRFVIDGGSSVFVIDQEKAKTLRLKTSGKGVIHGAGNGAIDVTYADSVTYDLNGIKMTVPKSTIIDLRQAIPGQKIDGIIGFDLFDKYVVQISYSTDIIRLFEPKDFVYSGKGSRIPITIKKKLIHVHALAKVAGRPAEIHDFVVDSGSSDNVDDVLIGKSAGSTTNGTGGVGLGKTFAVKIGYLDFFQIGKIQVKHIQGTSEAEVIGNGFLHNYSVIFDYTHKELILD